MATGVYTMGKTNISCDYGATATISGTTVTIANITTDTTCEHLVLVLTLVKLILLLPLLFQLM